ncbi:hypothetical protein AXF07_13505 [Staphylococcus aureus]|uniref:hypothetical protein n=1 Tax=Staphylococcus aureus TaxID=1280 RepID=UPI0005EB5A35|nr:hypothetical protein [Staphylococcus aureus]MCL9700062.1 hypothetical protein [Staphylococcus aureus]MCO4439531.1 hypothetical protein [Staphylococcus aureus]MCO4445179.1 hypothetical protein [Staphylococcus aureus]UXS90538.1 hypothetical protein MUA64_10640 [Staphylococcus aureus]UXS93200.1 hypothetical protein MUA08_10740 [Staphylococcus aureus]
MLFIHKNVIHCSIVSNFIFNLYIVTNFNLNFLSLKQIISSKLIVRKFKIFVDILKQI